MVMVPYRNTNTSEPIEAVKILLVGSRAGEQAGWTGGEVEQPGGCEHGCAWAAAHHRYHRRRYGCCRHSRPPSGQSASRPGGDSSGAARYHSASYLSVGLKARYFFSQDSDVKWFMVVCNFYVAQVASKDIVPHFFSWEKKNKNVHENKFWRFLSAFFQI